MKAKPIVILVVVLLAGSVIANAESHNSQSIYGGAIGGLTGNICALGTGWPPEPGGKVRGLIMEYFMVTDDEAIAEYVNGFVVCAGGDMNMDENGQGPVWGTFLFSKGDRVWEGTYNGQRITDFADGSSSGYWHTEGHGRGPGLQGKTIKLDSVTIGTGIDLIFVTITGNPEK